MAIIVDKDGNVVTVENQPEEARAMFPNLKDRGGVQDVLVNGKSVVNENGDADIPTATSQTAGTVMVGAGLAVNSNKRLTIVPASLVDIKSGAITSVNPIIPSRQYASAFYGMAAAAGDTTQALSDNAVGNYTDDAKVAIQKMLGVYREWELLNTITVEEDTAELIIDTDISGQPFEASELLVRVSIEPSTTGATSKIAAGAKTLLANDTTEYPNAPTINVPATAAYLEYTAALKADVCCMTGSAGGASNSTASLYRTTSGQNTSIKAITGFRFARYSASDTLIPAGSVIKLYGIRK